MAAWRSVSTPRRAGKTAWRSAWAPGQAVSTARRAASAARRVETTARRAVPTAAQRALGAPRWEAASLPGLVVPTLLLPLPGVTASRSEVAATEARVRAHG